MQPNSPIETSRERAKLEQLDSVCRNSLVIGEYYDKFSQVQKARFNRIVNSIARKMGVALNRSPMPVILIRQIAFNTIRIEQSEAQLIEEKIGFTLNDIEKWRFQAQKDLRESMETLMTLLKTTDKKQSLGSFGGMRNILRGKEGLEASEDYINPDGHDRRHYDDLTRTTSSDERD